ncbi:MAG: hypothetical protein ACKPEN_10265 [Planktothrix sp.]
MILAIPEHPGSCFRRDPAWESSDIAISLSATTEPNQVENLDTL